VRTILRIALQSAKNDWFFTLSAFGPGLAVGVAVGSLPAGRPDPRTEEEPNMKRPTRWIALGLFVATCAAGCGTENPTGPSFARTEPATETAVSTIPISEDPTAVEDGAGTTQPDAPVPFRRSNNGRRNGYGNGNHYGHD
jgi:hypothetical protein